MARLNPNKLQAQRNFKSIWHHDSQYLSQTLREDFLIRKYIEGTMKAREWKVSEIIIKRKVNRIHIAFQVHNKKIKEWKRWTKNRLKNQIKYQEKLKRKMKVSKKRKKSSRKKYALHTAKAISLSRYKGLSLNFLKKKRRLFFQVFLMITELRKMYPNNLISFYIQKVKPLQYNAHLVNSWIISNLKKKKSYKRLINVILSQYRKGILNLRPKKLSPSWKGLDENNKKIFASWVTANLSYLFNVHTSLNNLNPKLKTILAYKFSKPSWIKKGWKWRVWKKKKPIFSSIGYRSCDTARIVSFGYITQKENFYTRSWYRAQSQFKKKNKNTKNPNWGIRSFYSKSKNFSKLFSKSYSTYPLNIPQRSYPKDIHQDKPAGITAGYMPCILRRLSAWADIHLDKPAGITAGNIVFNSPKVVSRGDIALAIPQGSYPSDIQRHICDVKKSIKNNQYNYLYQLDKLPLPILKKKRKIIKKKKLYDYITFKSKLIQNPHKSTTSIKNSKPKSTNLISKNDLNKKSKHKSTNLISKNDSNKKSKHKSTNLISKSESNKKSINKTTLNQGLLNKKPTNFISNQKLDMLLNKDKRIRTNIALAIPQGSYSKDIVLDNPRAISRGDITPGDTGRCILTDISSPQAPLRADNLKGIQRQKKVKYSRQYRSCDTARIVSFGYASHTTKAICLSRYSKWKNKYSLKTQAILNTKLKLINTSKDQNKLPRDTTGIYPAYCSGYPPEQISQKLGYLNQKNKLINQQKREILKKIIKRKKRKNIPLGYGPRVIEDDMPCILRRLSAGADIKLESELKDKLKLQYIIKLKLALWGKKKKEAFNLRWPLCVKPKNNKLILKDLRSTWKLTRKKPSVQKRGGKYRKFYWKSHQKQFKEDKKALLNYYKLKYLSIKTLNHYDQLPKNIENTIKFLWQGKNFIKFLSMHPPLLDHVINCLIGIPGFFLKYPQKEDQLIGYLTHSWIGFFDYFKLYEKNLFKWQGIRIILSGRVGSRKMGRATRYTKSWGISQSSSARSPLQYTSSQIHTRYGVMGMKIFMH